MRKVFLILLLLCSSSVFSQKANPWSLAIGASSYGYVFDSWIDDYANKFNYEFYILPSKNFSCLKLTTGIMYSTKNIKGYEFFGINDNSVFHDLYKVDYEIDYIKVPILATVGYSFKIVRFSIFGGFILDHILNYRVKVNYLSGESSYKDYKFNDYNMSVRGGITISTEIFKNINLTLQPFVDYKIDPDDIFDNTGKWGSRDIYEYYYDLIPNGVVPDDLYNDYGGILSYGLSIGLEYTFK
ncbi:MAG: hypothetical protein SO179_06950 [Bacteroidales bacterium]|nr:hypothetical protein [Bacteroidales bacterium]